MFSKNKAEARARMRASMRRELAAQGIEATAPVTPGEQLLAASTPRLDPTAAMRKELKRMGITPAA